MRYIDELFVINLSCALSSCEKTQCGISLSVSGRRCGVNMRYNGALFSINLRYTQSSCENGQGGLSISVSDRRCRIM